MPPIRKFKREDIIDTAYNIVKDEGFESINARRIAKELGCSIQPIFHNFATMDELYKAVYDKISEKCREYMFRDTDKEKADVRPDDKAMRNIALLGYLAFYNN